MAHDSPPAQWPPFTLGPANEFNEYYTAAVRRNLGASRKNLRKGNYLANSPLVTLDCQWKVKAFVVRRSHRWRAANLIEIDSGKPNFSLLFAHCDLILLSPVSMLPFPIALISPHDPLDPLN
jgi:hypothetical protein